MDRYEMLDRAWEDLTPEEREEILRPKRKTKPMDTLNELYIKELEVYVEQRKIDREHSKKEMQHLTEVIRLNGLSLHHEEERLKLIERTIEEAQKKLQTLQT